MSKPVAKNAAISRLLLKANLSPKLPDRLMLAASAPLGAICKNKAKAKKSWISCEMRWADPSCNPSKKLQTSRQLIDWQALFFESTCLGSWVSQPEVSQEGSLLKNFIFGVINLSNIKRLRFFIYIGWNKLMTQEPFK